MAITRWEPFEELMPLRDAMSRLLEESFFSPVRRELFATGRLFPVDIRETADEYIIEASLPGMKPEEVEISAIGDTLTIHAATKREEKVEKAGNYIRHERYVGEVNRTLELPTVIDATRVDATYEHGVLTLRVPKAEEVKPKAIPVHVKSATETH